LNRRTTRRPLWLALLALALTAPALAATAPKAKAPAVKAAKAAEPKKEEPRKEEPKKEEAKEPGAEAKEEEKPPVTVKVGIYVLNIGKFDLATGTYTVDFYMDMTSVPPEQDMGEMKFEFMNGRASSMDKLIDKPGEKFYRIQANLATNVDMHRFPWDEHDLPITLEPATRGKKELIFTVDDKQSGIDPSVTFVGWDLRGTKGEVRDHVYDVYGESYSQFVYKIRIARIVFASSMKTFIPVGFFLFISLVSLLVALEKLDQRVALNTAMLIASVMFHMSIGAQLPPAGYLTVADKVLIATYGVIAVNLLMTVQTLRLYQLKQEQAAKSLRSLAFKLIPALAVLALGFAALSTVGG